MKHPHFTFIFHLSYLYKYLFLDYENRLPPSSLKKIVTMLLTCLINATGAILQLCSLKMAEVTCNYVQWFCAVGIIDNNCVLFFYYFSSMQVWTFRQRFTNDYFDSNKMLELAITTEMRSRWQLRPRWWWWQWRLCCWKCIIRVMILKMTDG